MAVRRALGGSRSKIQWSAPQGCPDRDTFIGWRGEDGPESSSLAELPGGGFDVEIDSTGDIHLAFYDLTNPVNASQLRYIRLGM